MVILRFGSDTWDTLSEKFADMISSELDRQLKPMTDALSAKDVEIADAHFAYGAEDDYEV